MKFPVQCGQICKATQVICKACVREKSSPKPSSRILHEKAIEDAVIAEVKKTKKERTLAKEAEKEAREAEGEAKRVKQREYQRRWRKRNPEKVQESLEKLRLLPRNPDKKRENDLRRRAKKAKSKVSKVSIKKLLELHGRYCYICDQPIEGELHFDHIIPLSKGGEHSMENLRPTHATCNLSKGAKILYDNEVV